MSKSEQTRQFIIEKAADLFNIKGYDSTSLSDVQDATGLTKGAIYGHFTDKNDLALAAFEHNASGICSRLQSLMNEQTSARKALLAFTGFYIQNWTVIFKKGGCPIQNAAVEADDHLDFLKSSVKKSINRVIKSLQQTIEKGQQNKEFKRSVSAEEYATIFFTIIEGGILLAKSMHDPKYIKLATDRVNLIIDQELKT
jgi:TetR/AcrR family transcriptional regulator, transcriptional repressor for nem operon